ncbi:MAG: hypothetical protein ACE5KM_07410 [Planctomycetaceae bacterium]
MVDWAADLAFVAVVLGVASVVQQRGAVKAGVRLFIVIAAGLVAMNDFEPLTAFLIRVTNGAGVAIEYGLFGSLIVLFAGSAALLELIANRLLPEPPDLAPRLDNAGRWVGGALAGIVTAAFLFTAVHTYPGPRDFWGYLPAEPAKRRGPILGNAPEEHWLRFTRHVSENVFARPDGRSFEPAETESTGDASPFVMRYARWRAERE